MSTFSVLLCACSVSAAGFAGDPPAGGEPPDERSPPGTGITGSFRVEKNTYCVGEPVFAVFEIGNNGKTPFSFYAMGSRAHHEMQFDVTIEDAAGRRLDPPPSDCYGGRGRLFPLQPGGERYIRYFLLSRWAHLLPPGEYVARASRTLKPDLRPESVGPTIRGIVPFTVAPYDHDKMKAAVLALGRELRGGGKGTFFRKPVFRALDDVAKTFNMSVRVRSPGDLRRDRGLADRIVAELPDKWDDRHYLEPKLDWNRNWLTADAPEEFTLTFSVGNNSRKPLQTGIPESRLCVDGKEIDAWRGMLAGVAKTKTLDRLEGGGVVEFALKLNEYVKEQRRFTWHINGRALESDLVRIRR